MDNWLPEFSTYHGYGVSTYARVHNTFLPFGIRGILPLHDGRIEAYGGGGRLHARVFGAGNGHEYV